MDKSETAVLGGGCFWCLEAVYRELRGVLRVEPGYAGGDTEDPTYEEVCSGRTGHAEVVRVTFDPKAIDYRQILEVFFSIHDPTTKDRQGADVGSQYRSIILHRDDDQRADAEQVLEELEREAVFGDPIVTELRELDTFWPAEPYHHGYFEQNPQQPYCQAVVRPKLQKFRMRWKELLR